MRNFLTLTVVAGAATAASLDTRSDTCSFQLKATGGESGNIGSLVDGQLRIGGATTGNDYGNNNLVTTAMGFTLVNGGVWDQYGSGCILAEEVDGSAQFQCDEGKQPTTGFSIATNGSLEYSSNSVFWACAASDVEFNLYTIPVPNQAKCYEIGLTVINESNCGTTTGSTGSTTVPVAGKSTTVPMAGKSTTVPVAGKSTTVPVAGKSTTVPVAGASTTSTEDCETSSTTVPGVGVTTTATTVVVTSVTSYTVGTTVVVTTLVTTQTRPVTFYTTGTIVSTVPAVGASTTVPVAGASTTSTEDCETSSTTVPAVGESTTVPVAGASTTSTEDCETSSTTVPGVGESTTVPVAGASTTSTEDCETSSTTVPGVGVTTTATTVVVTSVTSYTVGTTVVVTTLVTTQTRPVTFYTTGTIVSTVPAVGASTTVPVAGASTTSTEDCETSSTTVPAVGSSTTVPAVGESTTVPVAGASTTSTEDCETSSTTVPGVGSSTTVPGVGVTTTAPGPEKTVYITVSECPPTTFTFASATGSSSQPAVPTTESTSDVVVIYSTATVPPQAPTSKVTSVPGVGPSTTEICVTSYTTSTHVGTTVVSTTFTSCPTSAAGCTPGSVGVVTLTTTATTLCPITSTHTQVLGTGFSTVVSGSSSCTDAVSGSATTTPAVTVPTGVTATKTTTGPVTTTTNTGNNLSSGTCLPNITLENNYFFSTTVNYQYPHLIIPVSNLTTEAANTAKGTQYFGDVSGNTSTIFNFDIPGDWSGKTCSLVFLLPRHEDLETTAYTTWGSGNIDFVQLSAPAANSTTYNTKPSVAKDLGTFPITTPSQTRVETFACPAGQTIAYEMIAREDTYLDWFNDWNPSPLGLFITYC